MRSGSATASPIAPWCSASTKAQRAGAGARHRGQRPHRRPRRTIITTRSTLAFRLIAAEEPERVRIVDASGAPEEVTQRLLDAIADLLP